MSVDCGDFWSTLPAKVLHPVRVPMVEALRCIGEPLSAVELVDVLDGFLSMWEAMHHLVVLETLDVVERASADPGGRTPRHGPYGAPYRLKCLKSDDGTCDARGAST
jgi:hypothetical protein